MIGGYYMLIINNIRNIMKQLGMAGGTGFEPVLAESESAVLPLDEPPSVLRFIL